MARSSLNYKDTPGRECWVQSYLTPSGQRTLTPTLPFTE